MSSRARRGPRLVFAIALGTVSAWRFREPFFTTLTPRHQHGTYDYRALLKVSHNRDSAAT
jgi:hypothetical protein